jgi:hypothetical protein
MKHATGSAGSEGRSTQPEEGGQLPDERNAKSLGRVLGLLNQRHPSFRDDSVAI